MPPSPLLSGSASSACCVAGIGIPAAANGTYDCMYIVSSSVITVTYPHISLEPSSVRHGHVGVFYNFRFKSFNFVQILLHD